MSVDKYTFKKNLPKKDRKCLNFYGWIINKLQTHYEKCSKEPVIVKEYTAKEIHNEFQTTNDIDRWVIK